mgnify:CR=1 FL=1
MYFYNIYPYHINIIKDIKIDTLDTYYVHAKIFHKDSILGYLSKCIAKNILKLGNPSTSILKKTDPQFIANALQHTDLNQENATESLVVS